VFLAQSGPTQLYDSLYGAGSTTFSTIGTTHGWIYNAMGYDPANKFLYAVSTPSTNKAYPAGHLLEIGSTGEIEDHGAITGDTYLTTDGANNGAFDASSNLWVTAPGDADLDEIDIATTPPKVLKKVVVSPAKGWHPTDFSYDSGYMWGMAQLGTHVYVYRLDTATGAIASFLAPSSIALSSSFGAAWTYGNGNLGFDANTTGDIYEIAVTAPTSSKPSFRVVATYTGPKTNASDDGAACVPTPVDLGIVKTGPATVAASGKITWTLKVTNHGAGISSGFVVNDAVPAGVTGVASTSAGCKVAGGAVTCDEGELKVGVTDTFTVTGNAPAAGNTCVTNTATVTGNEHDPNPANNTSSVKTCTDKTTPSLTETPPSSGTAGSSFTDEVTVAGGTAPTGTISYALYGPSEPTCAADPEQTVTTTVSGDGPYTSPGVVINTVGNYWWVASYSGDAANNGSATSCADGFFTVTTAPPGSCTIDWAGPSSGGLWATAADWNLDRTPTAGDVVCIGTSGSTFTGPVVFDGSNGTSDTAIDQIKSYDALDVTSGELNITDTSTNPDLESFVDGLDMTGGQIGDTTNTEAGFTDSGAFTWSGGSFFAPAAETPTPVLTDSAGVSTVEPGGSNLNNWGLDLGGTTSFAGTIYDYHGGTITLSGAGSIPGYFTMVDEGSPGTFSVTSAGTLDADDSGGSPSIEVPYDFIGAVTVSAGTFILGSDGGTLNKFTVASGAILQLAPSSNPAVVDADTDSGTGELLVSNGLVNAAGASFPGALVVQNGELSTVGTSDFSVGSFDLSGGQLGDTGTTQEGLTVSGAFTWSGGSLFAPAAETPTPVITDSAGVSTVEPGGSNLNNWGLDLGGTTSFAGTIYDYHGGAITLSGAGSIAGYFAVTSETSPGVITVTSTGSLTADSGANPQLAIAIVNDGTITSESATFTIGSLTNNGTLNIATSQVTIQSSYSPASTSVLAVTIAGATAGSTYGQLVVNGTFAVAGTLDVTTPGSFVPTSGELFTISTYTSGSGSFSTVNTTGAASYDAPDVTSTEIQLEAE
jgi:hypothetical protein